MTKITFEEMLNEIKESHIVHEILYDVIECNLLDAYNQIDKNIFLTEDLNLIASTHSDTIVNYFRRIHFNFAFHKFT